MLIWLGSSSFPSCNTLISDALCTPKRCAAASRASRTVASAGMLHETERDAPPSSEQLMSTGAAGGGRIGGGCAIGAGAGALACGCWLNHEPICSKKLSLGAEAGGCAAAGAY